MQPEVKKTEKNKMKVDKFIKIVILDDFFKSSAPCYTSYVWICSAHEDILLIEKNYSYRATAMMSTTGKIN
jgi:hypothetical protein